MTNQTIGFSVLIRAAANSLEVTMTEKSISLLADESETFIKNFISDLSVSLLTSRSLTLTKEHVANVMKSRDEPPLLGYNQKFIEDEHQEPSETTEKQLNVVPLTNYITEGQKFLSRKVPFGIRYSLVDGIKAPLNPKTYRPRSDRPRSESIDCVAAALSKTQIDYIVDSLYYMRQDTNNSFELGLKEILEGEERINTFTPYLIHIITGKMATQLHNEEKMVMLMRISIALVSNPNIDLITFFHPFLRICMTGLVATDVGSNDTDDDSEVRKYAAELLHILHVKCKKAFPLMSAAVFDYLISIVFNSSTSIAAQTGAFYGITALGVASCEKFIPHLPGYIAALRSVASSSSFIKNYHGKTAAEAIRSLCEKIINESKIDEMRYRAEESLELLDSIVFK